MHGEISEIYLKYILKYFQQVGATETKCALTVSDHKQEHSTPKATMEQVSCVSGCIHVQAPCLPQFWDNIIQLRTYWNNI